MSCSLALLLEQWDLKAFPEDKAQALERTMVDQGTIFAFLSHIQCLCIISLPQDICQQVCEVNPISTLQLF